MVPLHILSAFCLYDVVLFIAADLCQSVNLDMLGVLLEIDLRHTFWSVRPSLFAMSHVAVCGVLEHERSCFEMLKAVDAFRFNCLCGCKMRLFMLENAAGTMPANRFCCTNVSSCIV